MSDPDLLSKWTAAISRVFWIPTTFCEICELHFKKNYFSGTKRKRLKPNAVPTENLGKYMYIDNNYIIILNDFC